MNSKPDQWIDDIIGNSKPIEPAGETEETLIKLLIDYCYNNRNIAENNIGLLLASAFDLFVAMQYYSRLLHNGWLYCPSDEPRLFFHYTNCCPRHALKNEFHFHKSKKPQSGVIGTATAKILLLFFKYLFEYNGLEEQVLKGREPVDAIILNKDKKKVLFAEIKASPLMTPSVSMRCQRIMEDVDGVSTDSGHHDISNTGLFHSDLEICIPKFINDHWSENYFTIGKRAGGKDTEWGMRGIINLINNDHSFYPHYYAFWKKSLSAYYPKKPDSIFWLTNACGAPKPIPDDWAKRRNGSGYESISDSKTSVGMDRTDDIKKGTYQVLKLGADGKRINSDWSYKVGIISNIHAARHFDQYLESIKDIVWTLDLSGKVKKASDLPEDQEMYNLFDCVIALTNAISKDDWLADLFKILD